MKAGAWPLWVELSLMVLLTLLVTNGLTLIVAWHQWADKARNERLGVIEDRLSALVPLMLQLPDSQWEQLLKVASVRHETVSVDAKPAVAVDAERDARAEARMRAALFAPGATPPQDQLRVSRRIRLQLNMLGDKRRRVYVGLDVAVPLAEGRWLNAKFRWPDEDGLFPGLAGSAGVSAIVLCLLSVWLAGRLGSPLEQLAHASRVMQLGKPVAPLDAGGPFVVRRAIQSFNDMAQRLMPIVDGQRVVLASVGHDLRTPIASLRIKSEFIEDDDLKQSFVGSLDELQSMTEAALEASRSGVTGEAARRIDLTALADSLCADLASQGHKASCQSVEPLVVSCRPAEVRRALRNLIDNAIKYGDSAQVSVATRAGIASVIVEDEGPGIRDSDLPRAFEPFVRLVSEGAGESPGRASGHGLGLAIARTIARAHGGDVILSNRERAGLRAEMTLRV